MTIHELLNAALTPVLANTWAVALPPAPVWPAAVFDVDSAPEEAWCMGGGYSRHDVNLLVMARTIEDLDALLPLDGSGPFRDALEGLEAYQYEEDAGDGDYEDDPDIYARYLTVRLRTPRY
ncbi:hypothetical protein [Acidovorax sp. BLS4]|uniref:hypothetical protein n=1 Tax=Acidovorax sp. BLS4 TaxID=3273430 RepID=UPI0029436E57|nr:hypothetical protein [Paracidovorax avenae]WOI43783.1 hypothetical protein R1Z03_14685 [Paracidovorax avenae]